MNRLRKYGDLNMKKRPEFYTPELIIFYPTEGGLLDSLEQEQTKEPFPILLTIVDNPENHQRNQNARQTLENAGLRGWYGERSVPDNCFDDARKVGLGPPALEVTFEAEKFFPGIHPGIRWGLESIERYLERNIDPITLGLLEYEDFST